MSITSLNEICSPTYRMRVFVSSIIDDKYTRIRQEIYNKLINTNFIEVYMFETSGSSSGSARAEYMSNIDRSDVVVVLIDNDKDVTKPVNDEINRAYAKGKKILYFFFNKKNKKITKLQESLSNPNSPKYTATDDFEKLPCLVYKSILNNLLTAYLANYNQENIENVNNNHILVDDMNIDVFASNVLNNTYDCVINRLMNTIGYENKIIKTTENKLDYLLSVQIKSVIGLEKFNSKIFKELSAEIEQIFTNDFKKVIKKRLKAQKSYYLGLYDKCYSQLKRLYNYSSKTNIPNWYLNDISMDMIFVERLISYEQGSFPINLKSDEFVKKSNTPVYFPIIDRKNAQFEKEINKEYYYLNNASLYSTRLVNVSHFFDPISIMFCISSLFGSIHQINNIKFKLIDLYSCILKGEYNYSMSKEYIRLLIYSKDIDKLKEYLRVCSNKHSLLHVEDIDSLLKSIDSIPESEESLMILIGTFGYNINEENFIYYTKKINNYIESVICGNKKHLFIWNTINYYINNIYLRLDAETLTSLCLGLLNSKNIYQPYFKTINLFNNVDYKKISKETQITIKKLFYDLLNEKNIRLEINEVLQPIIVLCINSSIDTSDLIELIKDKDINMYNDILVELSLNNKKYNKSIVEEYVNDNIDLLYKRTEYSNSGVQIEYSNNPSIILFNILSFTKYRLKKDQLNRILDVCVKICLSNNQTIRNKLDTIKLLNIILSRYCSMNGKSKIVGKLYNATKDFLNAVNTSPFEKHSIHNLKVGMLLLYSVYNNENYESLFNVLYFEKSNDDYNNLVNIRTIKYFIENDNSNSCICQLNSDQ